MWFSISKDQKDYPEQSVSCLDLVPGKFEELEYFKISYRTLESFAEWNSFV